jgi:hypothetical protein
MQALQSTCLHITTTGQWYVRQINNDSGIPFLDGYIRELTESFDSKLADVGTSYFGKLVGTFAKQRINEVSGGQPRRTDAQQASQVFSWNLFLYSGHNYIISRS